MNQPNVTDSAIEQSRRIDDTLRSVDVEQIVADTVEEAKRGEVSYDEPRLDHQGDDSFDFKLSLTGGE